MGGGADVTVFSMDAKAAWDEGAIAYAAFVESGADYYRSLVHGPALLGACGDARGLEALDIGCGQGYFSRKLAEAGARVTGVEISERLIARARELEIERPLGIGYILLDASSIGEHFDSGRFELVTGCMSLQDMAEPGAVLGGARRVLRSGGRAVFSIPHPCTDTPFRRWERDGARNKLYLCNDRYFDTGPTVCRWEMARFSTHWETPYHRKTLSEWSALIGEAGFVIDGLIEPRPTAETIAAHPETGDCARMPYFLIFKLVIR